MVDKDKRNAFKTKRGRTVYDGGGITPDVALETSQLSPITSAILDEHHVFNFATQYYYKNNVTDLQSFKLSDADFNAFKSYLKSTNFSFETKTEKAFETALAVAKNEELNTVVNSEYTQLIASLNAYKNKAVDDNKTQLLDLLSDEIVKRYFYREGMYSYYVNHNTEIQKGVEILKNPSTYMSYLQ